MQTVRLKSWVWGGILVLCLAIASAAGLSTKKGKDKPKGKPPPVPVVVEQATQEDVPLIVRALGTAQPLQSVVVRAQIDGMLSDIRFEEGQKVQEGDLVAKIDDRSRVAELAHARAARASHVAELETAKLDLTRYSNLLEADAVARQRVDQQRAQVQQLEAALQADDAAIAAAQVQLSFTRITAPITGRLGLRQVNRGNVVRAADAKGLVTITQVDPIAVHFAVPQDLISEVASLLSDKNGAKAVAFARSGGPSLGEGRLVALDNQIDPATGTLEAKAEFPNPEGKLWPGQFVTVELQTGTLPDATVVSTRAVRRGPEGMFVFKIVDDKAKLTPVRVRHDDGRKSVLENGVQPGDVVVVDGHSRLVADSPVSVNGPPRPKLVSTQPKRGSTP